MRFRSAVRAISIVSPIAIAAVLAGCSGDTLKGLGAATPAGTGTQTAAGVGAAQTDVECPVIQVRNGASTWQTPTGGGTTELKYQASLGQMARECAILGDTMTVKVGVEGRVLTGPKGTPGTIQVPLRLALVHEGPNPKSIWTKFYPVPVTITPGQSGVPFTHVEDDLTFALPPDKDISAYVIYVGFDPQGLARQQKHTPAKHKAAPQAKKKAAPRPASQAKSNGTPPAAGGFAPPASGGFAPPPNSPPGGGTFAPPPGQFTPPPKE